MEDDHAWRDPSSQFWTTRLQPPLPCTEEPLCPQPSSISSPALVLATFSPASPYDVSGSAQDTDNEVYQSIENVDGYTDSKLPQRCHICGKRFKYPKDLRRHDLVHTGARPFQCRHCSKRFNRVDNLTRHKRVHAKGARDSVSSNSANVDDAPSAVQTPQRRNASSASWTSQLETSPVASPYLESRPASEVPMVFTGSTTPHMRRTEITGLPGPEEISGYLRERVWGASSSTVGQPGEFDFAEPIPSSCQVYYQPSIGLDISSNYSLGSGSAMGADAVADPIREVERLRLENLALRQELQRVTHRMNQGINVRPNFDRPPIFSSGFNSFYTWSPTFSDIPTHSNFGGTEISELDLNFGGTSCQYLDVPGDARDTAMQRTAVPVQRRLFAFPETVSQQQTSISSFEIVPPTNACPPKPEDSIPASGFGPNPFTSIGASFHGDGYTPPEEFPSLDQLVEDEGWEGMNEQQDS